MQSACSVGILCFVVEPTVLNIQIVLSIYARYMFCGPRFPLNWLHLSILEFYSFTLGPTEPYLAYFTLTYKYTFCFSPLVSFLFNWLDLLAFSLSGLKAEGTSCAAMAYVMADLHREGAKLGDVLLSEKMFVFALLCCFGFGFACGCFSSV